MNKRLLLNTISFAPILADMGVINVLRPQPQPVDRADTPQDERPA